jgi:hypothetical protein
LPYLPKKSFKAGSEELIQLLDRMKGDVARRIQALFVHNAHKFYTVVIYPCAASGADKPKSPALEVSELMESLLSAARELDYERVAVICHEIETPSLVAQLG